MGIVSGAAPGGMMRGARGGIGVVGGLEFWRKFRRCVRGCG